MEDYRVLMLNQSYLPLAMVGWKRAICLLFQEAADAVVESGLVVSSPSTQMKIPTVIRLRSNIYPQKRGIRLSRKNVLLRDEQTCQYCGKTFSKDRLNLDHVVPRSQGGLTRWTNIVTSCIEDNIRKGGRTPAQAGMVLLQEPDYPRWTLAQEIVHNIKVIPEEWEPYLGAYMRRAA